VAQSMTSGTILAQARERKGMDLNTVARRLRIRPDILRAIEAGDHAAMPPRGYTRNMVNAYARLVGLNPTEIVDLYLEEAYANQVEKDRYDDPRSLRFRSSDAARSRSRSTTPNRDEAYERMIQRDHGHSSALGRALYDDRTQFSRDDYGVTRERNNRSGRSERDFLSHHSGYSADDFAKPAPRIGFQRQRAIHVGTTPSHYSAPRFSFLSSRLPIIIAAAVVVIIAIVLAMFIFGGKDDQPSTDVSTLPVSGLNDTTKTEEDEDDVEPVREVAPTSAHVNYSVAAGHEVYAEFYINDEFSAEMLTGPESRNVEVTGTWTITTWTPDDITVTVDGEKVTLTADEKYNGMSSYTVDFGKKLEEWNATHDSSASRREAANAAATAAAQQAESGSDSNATESSEQSQSAGQTA